ncbi:MAG TPA: hypothetical protein VFG33_02985 [Kribbella sp.]|uniref:hypothetical protein n=1 Tax=Kribbella sp. TaxID=1871183 RepID=UPI002D78B105|nr:hypothetical protein [Kribbella sp.]HET6292304.1 hypothetical protein [Kribbella sp.]
MLIILLVSMIFLADATYWITKRTKRGRLSGDPFEDAFGESELRKLDSHLEEVALEELRRLERQLTTYVGTDVGHVLMISRSAHGIALELSDGRRMALGGVSPRIRHILTQRAASDELRPAHVQRDAFSYRLLLRGGDGEIEVHARHIALAP